MARADLSPTIRLSRLRSFFVRVASADVETLARCPKQDHETVTSVAVIMLMTAIYQCALFTVVGNHLFGTPGQFNPVILGVSAFIAFFIMRVDAFTIMRSGWHQNGIAELKRGGLDISGGTIERVKAGILLTVRVALALGSAQLTATFACDFVFARDIAAWIESDNARANAPLVATVTARTDGNIQNRRDEIAAQKGQIADSTLAVSALRKQENDLMSSEPRLQDAQAEITRLGESKTKAEDEIQQAETFALNEAAGVKGAPNNSGEIGEGVRYRAANERVANAKARVAEIDASLAIARGHLDDLTKQFTARTDAMREQFEGQIGSLEKSVDGAETHLATLEADLTQVVKDRGVSIQSGVHSAENYVPQRTGLLIQIAALRGLADGNPEIAVVILLIEVVSFGLELAAVLAKVTSFVPTTYAALLARDAYMQAVTIVDDMVQELDQRKSRTPNPDPEPEPEIANDNNPEFEAPSIAVNAEVLSDEPTPPPPPPKRPRGRPRKVPVE